MLKTTIAGLRAHLLRLLLTGLAITLGVGFVSGTFVLTDTMRAGFDRQFTASASRVSVAVLPGKGVRRIPASVLAGVRAVPGVQDARGQVRGDAPLLGRDGRVYGETPTLGLSIPDGPLRRYDLAEGRAPSGPGDVVLDMAVARHTGYRIGDSVAVLDGTGARHAFTVTGLVDFGVDREIGYRGAVGFTEDVAARMTGEHGFTEIDVKAAAGTGDQRLRDAVAAAAGPSYTVLTGAGLADRQADAAGVDMRQIATFFLAFALVALFVAALVIYNTFNILIAQRVREMALLRCVGATRGQVFGGVLAESAVVGLLASVLGAVAGIGLGYGGAAIFNSGPGAPGGVLTVSATPFLVGIPVGLAVTVVSALLPARAATRVPPVAALRTQAEGPVRTRAGIVRTVAGSVLVLAGAALFALALTLHAGQGPFLIAVAGGLTVFFGVVALSPLIVRALSGVVGGVPARLFGVPGRLALENSRRNPRRAAVTTIALTVGVTLMTMFSAALASARATGDAMITHQYPVDYQLGMQFGDDRPLPGEPLARLRADRRFAKVIEVKRTTATVNGRKRTVGTITGRVLGGTFKPHVTAGSVAGLGSGDVVLAEDVAAALHARVGGSITVGSPRGPATPRVAAIVSRNDVLPAVLLDETAFARLFGPKDDAYAFLIVRKGVSAGESRAAVDAALRPYPAVRVRSTADIKEQYTDALNRLFLLVAALLALAIVISLIGIANTLTLSVVERTRESALLRALGLTRRGLRRTLSLEALIISVIGALIGVVLGLAFGWIAMSAATTDVVLGLPILRIVVFVLVAGVAGVLAAALPGRRAARTSIVESLAAE